MARVMTIEDIKTAFQSEWVLLEDPQTDESQRVKSGKVLFHSKGRDELDRQMLSLRPKHGAVLYTGGIPKGTAVIL